MKSPSPHLVNASVVLVVELVADVVVVFTVGVVEVDNLAVVVDIPVAKEVVVDPVVVGGSY